MHGRTSRQSYAPAKRFSGLYQIQGGMVTDADLGESVDIAKGRVNDLGLNAVGDGVPHPGGAIEIAADGKPRLVPGIVYADGVRGVISADGAVGAGALDLYLLQTDFPQPPPLPTVASVFYADLWDRPVFAIEDERLSDPGLHGSETSFRTRTMAQIKWAPAAARDNIDKGLGRFPRIGTAVLTAAAVDVAAAPDPCDPCRTEIHDLARISNALVRLEVVDVVGPADHPDRVVLAWSTENAAEQFAAANVPADFNQPGHIYEFFSEITEASRGVFADPGQRKRGVFVDNLPAAVPARTDGVAGNWPFVRRWDGTAELAAGALGTVKANGAQVSLGANGLRIAIGAFAMNLDMANKSFVAGDFWLIELREFAPEAQRIRVVSSTPVGIEHHYVVLFETDDAGNPKPLTDAERRRLSFPALSDIPADHVSYVPGCDNLYAKGGRRAENVQQALDALCGIEAADIHFRNPCQDTYGDAKDVHAALKALCNRDIGIERMLRLLFDWGVVCGLRVRPLSRTGVNIDNGVLLDRAGRLVSCDWQGQTKFDLNDGNRVKVLAAINPGRLTEVCLALAADNDRKVGVFLVDKAVAFGPADPTMGEHIKECTSRKPIWWNDAELIAGLSVADRKTIAGVKYGVGQQATFKGSIPLDRAKEKAVADYAEAIFQAYRKVASETEAAAVAAKMKAADDDFDPRGLPDSAVDVLRGDRAIAKLGAVFAPAANSQADCFCANAYPTCPPELGAEPYFVPIACLHVRLEGGRIDIEEVCEFCCRKQALTPRALRYWSAPADDYDAGGNIWDDPQVRLHGLAKDYKCCPPPRKPGGGQPVFPPRGPIGPIRDEFRRWPPVPPAIARMPHEEAIKVFSGHGIQVENVLDLGDPAIGERLAGLASEVTPLERLAGKAQAQPGDKVALLVRNGIAQDYLLLERGTGWSAFEPVKKPVAPAPVELTGVKDELADVKAQRDTLEQEIKLLGGERATLAGTVTGLRADIAKLSNDQAKVIVGIGQAKLDLTEISRQRETLIGNLDIRSVTEDVDKLTTRRAALADTLTALRTDIAKLSDDETKVVTGVGQARRDLDELGRQQAAANTELQNRKAELEQLATNRDRLAGEITALANQRTELTGAVENLRGTLGQVSTNVDKAKQELTGLAEQRDEFVRTMRSNHPVAAVIGDKPEVVARLAQLGVLTAGDLARLADNQARRTEVVNTGVLGNATAVRGTIDKARNHVAKIE